MKRRKLATVAVVVLAILGAVGGWVAYMASPTKGSRIAAYSQPRKALVVVDMEEDCVGPDARPPFPYRNAQQMIAAINPLIAQAEQQGTPVVFVNQTFGGIAGTVWSRVFVGGRLREGSPGTLVDRRLSTGSHPQFAKPKGDAFSNPALDAYLIKNQVDTVVIAGVDAEFCVHLTAQGALNRGYKVVLVKDAIGLMHEKKWDELLSSFAKEGIQVVEGRDVKF